MKKYWTSKLMQAHMRRNTTKLMSCNCLPGSVHQKARKKDWPKKVGFDMWDCIWKNGPSSRENEVKISTTTKCKMAKNHYSRANFGSWGVLLGVLEASELKSGLRILIQAPKVWFLEPRIWLKRGHYSHFGRTKNGTLDAQFKILIPLFK